MRSWSVGMAVSDKPPYFYESVRAKFTAQSLLIHHPEVAEVVIVDNDPHPDSPLKDLAAKNGQIRLVDMPEPKGTAAPRNRVFREARFDYVACIDPHVLLYPEFFEALDDFYSFKGRDCPDLVQGPMMNEAIDSIHATHMNDQWRCQMWGTWGMAWVVPGRPDMFSCITPDGRELVYVSMFPKGGQRPLSHSEILNLGLPLDLGWAGHETKLVSLGFYVPRLTPFPIPGHGMGFFACRKDSWLPFHAGCRGFGGEEMTTHCRFRRAGRTCWCVPGAEWWHDLWRPNRGAVPYRLTAYDKMRNYCLEFAALQMDPAPIRAHFRPPEHEWRQAMEGAEWPAGAAPPPDSAVAAPKTGGGPPGRGFVFKNGEWVYSGGAT